MGKKAATGETGGPKKELTGPLSFVYDLADASVPLDGCSCVWNAANCDGVRDVSAEAFLERYGLPRELRFEPTIARRKETTDWWGGLYRE